MPKFRVQIEFDLSVPDYVIAKGIERSIKSDWGLTSLRGQAVMGPGTLDWYFATAARVSARRVDAEHSEA